MNISRFLWPDGKRITSCWDDGTIYDRHLVAMCNRYGLKASFNLCSGKFGLNAQQSGWKEFIRADEVAALYQGHEVCSHTVDHPRMWSVPIDQLRWEILEDRSRLEALVGYPVRGFAIPYNWPTGQNWCRDFVRSCGIKYMRNSASVPQFEHPSDFMDWHPTAHCSADLPALWASMLQRNQDQPDLRLRNSVARDGLEPGWHARPQQQRFAALVFFEKHYSNSPQPRHVPFTLHKGDRLALIGDSITEANRHSRMLETYLAVCAPDLEVEVRNLGRGGETAQGFLERIESDCLHYQPTVATMCYGMNDAGYLDYNRAGADTFRAASARIVSTLKAAGVRMVLASPGCIGRLPAWEFVNELNGTLDGINTSLLVMRDEAALIAEAEQLPFVDHFWNLYRARFASAEKYGADYAVCGADDGVHPSWAGHVVMAFGLFSALGFDGDLGHFTIDLATKTATTTGDHVFRAETDNAYAFTSGRYPFCAEGMLDKDWFIRSGMTLVPFNQRFNRMTLRMNGTSTPVRNWKRGSTLPMTSSAPRSRTISTALTIWFFKSRLLSLPSPGMGGRQSPNPQKQVWGSMKRSESNCSIKSNGHSSLSHTTFALKPSHDGLTVLIRQALPRIVAPVRETIARQHVLMV